MDEDDDTRSHTSIGSEPPSPPSGQITVTVAAAPPSSTPSSSTPQPPPQLSQSSLTLALPIQQFPRPLAILAPAGSGGSSGGGGGGSGGGGGGREDCWSEGATSVLIDAWGERYMELSRGNLKQKHWKEVADIVSSREDFTKVPKTDIQCKNRIDTVKKKYKVEKQKVVSGCGPSRWPFFDRLDRLIGPAAATPNSNTAKGLGSGLGPLSTATVSTGGPLPHGKAVPVGIPVGVRQHQQPLPLPFPPHYLQTPPHLQSPHPPLRSQQLQHQQRQQQQLQQQQLRQSLQFSPPSGIPHMRYSNNNNNMNTSASGVASNVNRLQQLEQIQKHQQQFRRVPPPVESDSDPEEWSHDSGDSLPPERTGFNQRKRPRMDGNRGGVRGKGKGKGRDKKAAVKVWGSSVRDLTRAIMKFGEAYEAAESAKLQHIVEMEMQRMKFAKELELQRMKFMMKTQLELSQLNNGSNNSDSRGGGGGGGSGGGVGGGESNHMNHLHENHMNHHANSDSSN